MNLTIQLPDVADVDGLRDYAERSLRFALTRYNGVVSAVRLRLVDENGPRGGTDQRCRVEVLLREGAPVNVEGVEANPRAVIDRVAARAARTVARRVSRARTLGLRA